MFILFNCRNEYIQTTNLNKWLWLDCEHGHSKKSIIVKENKGRPKSQEIRVLVPILARQLTSLGF